MRKNEKNHEEATTAQRDWHDLKSGDVIFFATGWYEVFDACMVTMNTMVLKLLVDGHIESYRFYIGNNKATCLA